MLGIASIIAFSVAVFFMIMLVVSHAQAQEMGMLFLNNSQYCHDHFNNGIMICHDMNVSGMNMSK